MSEYVEKTKKIENASSKKKSAQKDKYSFLVDKLKLRDVSAPLRSNTMYGRTPAIQGMWDILGKPIQTLADLNNFLKEMDSAHLDITVQEFGDATQQEIDAYIEQTSETPYSRAEAITNITVGLRLKRAKGADAEAAKKQKESEELEALKSNLKWKSVKDRKKGGVFIGNSAYWHIHTEIETHEHLKFGNDQSSRKSTCKEKQLLIAIGYLILMVPKLNVEGAQDCYNWMRNKYIKLTGEDIPENLRIES